MAKKVLFAALFGALVVFGLLFSQMTEEALADASLQLEQAEQYEEDGNYEQVEAIYKVIVTDYPGTDDAFKAQEKLTVLYILWDKQAEAEAALDDLLANFSENEGIAEAVDNVADEYRNLKRYEEAGDLYEYIVDTWPEAEKAVESQKDVAISNIALGNDTASQAAIDKLLTEYSDHEDIAMEVDKVADEYREVGKHQNALELYEHVVNHWPQHRDAIWSQRGVAMSNIALGNETAAQAAIDKLLSNYSGHEDIAKAVDRVADEYREVGKHQKAIELYQHVVNHWPQHRHAIWSQRGVGMSNAALGNDTALEAAIDKLISDFSAHPDLPEAILGIAAPYYSQGLRGESGDPNGDPNSQIRSYFQKAVTICERVKTEFPDYTFEADTCCWEGACYRKLGEYAKSIECYQKVVDEYPTCGLAWHALFMVGRNYEDLKESGTLSQSEADAEIRAAYEQLLEEYPDCKAAKLAHRWLSHHNLE